MKYKIPILFLLSFTFTVFPKACLDFTKGNAFLSLLNSMQPESTIIKNGTETTITESGSYHLIETITGKIRVDANNVIINLNGFAIGAPDEQDVIRVNTGHENIIIRNGTVLPNGEGEGVQLNAGVKNVILEDLKIYGGDRAIYLSGGEGDRIECCLIKNCVATGCEYGVSMWYADKCVLIDCEVCECWQGFNLNYCRYNKIKQCKAIRIQRDDEEEKLVETFGFSSSSGLDNLFYECMVEGVNKSENNWGIKTGGFKLGFDGAVNPERESKIINCCVDSITSSEGNAFGICLESDIYVDFLNSLTAGLFDGTINDVDWSPQGDYVAIACSDSTVRVLHFDGTTLRQIDSATHQAPVNAVAWSPDGHHLAVGTDGYASIVDAQAWVGYRQTDNPQVDGLHAISFLNEVKKEVFVYKFESDSLVFIDDERVGLVDVTIYDGSEQVYSQASIFGSPSNIITPPGLPGPIRILPAWPGGDWSFYGNWPLTVGQGKAPDDVLRIIWSRDGRHLFVTTKGKSISITSNTNWRVDSVSYYIYYTSLNFTADEQAKLVNLSFDGTSLHIVENRVIDSRNSSHALALTPDDEVLIYGLSQESQTLNLATFEKFYGTVDVLNDSLTSGTSVKSADWNPIACCGKYYLATVGYEGSGTTQNVEVFEYDVANNILTSLAVANADVDLTDVKWAPDGKSFVITGTTNNLVQYWFDPTNINVIGVGFTYPDLVVDGNKFVDWSPCGRYIVVGGDIWLGTTNIEVFTSGSCVTDCVVQNNKIANVSGGLCGIGIFGPGCCNLIERNLLSGSCVNASEGVFNTFYDMKVSNTFAGPRPLDNIAFEGSCCSAFCS